MNGPEVEIVAASTGRIRLRAVCEGGEPVERVDLHVRSQGKKQWTWLGAFSSDAEGWAEWVTEAGRLELCASKVLAGCPPTLLGPFVLEDHGELVLECRLARVAETEFVLDPPLDSGMGTLQFERTDAEALPRDGGYFGSAVSLLFADGHERVPALAAGRYRVLSSTSRVEVHPAEFELGSDRSQPVRLTWNCGD